VTAGPSATRTRVSANRPGSTRYKGGVTNYLGVITAQSAALSDEVTAVNILGRRMADTVLLIQALGGGWDRSTLPPRPECCGKLANNNNGS
jgi:outer membrane protein TolC